MEERIDFLVEQKPRNGVSTAVIVSLIVHTLLMIYVIRSYHPVASQQTPQQIVRYVELMRQSPGRTFTEAPGRKVQSSTASAPFSDANRKASMPQPTGDKATPTPGAGARQWTPPPQPAGDGRQAGRPTPTIQQQASAPSASEASAAQSESGSNASSLAFRQQPAGASSGAVDWKNAIRQVGAPGGSGPKGLDLGGAGGGEKGFAESGPLSFETQWYDWGEYAESMVSRIRVNWYGNMPQLIRTGMKGVVTIRFTIHRDGHLTDVTILNSSGIPPYDFAAKHAIELSSPLNPLPKDFPNETERVTCMFYYNMEIPRG